METKFVITHANHRGVRHILRLPEGQTYFVSSNQDLFQALCVGSIEMAGSAYCVRLGDEPPFMRELLRDVRSEISKRDPQWAVALPV